MERSIFKLAIAMLCITCCVDYNEAKNGEIRAKAKQWCKDKKLVAKKFGENVKGKAKEKAEEIGKDIEHSAKRKLYDKAFEFYILPIDKKRSELVDMLSAKTTINMLVLMYSLISSNKKDDLISKINEVIKTNLNITQNFDIMTAKKQDIKGIINGIEGDLIENLSSTLIKKPLCN